MGVIFDYDWWHGDGLSRQVAEAKRRCARAKFPDTDPASANGAYTRFINDLEARTIVYLRDNAVYEIKELADVGRRGYLTFECLPAEEAYRVGSFLVAVPFDEISRVEIFAVHPREKPEENPLIKGFGGGMARSGARADDPGLRSDMSGSEDAASAAEVD